MEPLEADYIIVGAGSAGCVLANRLSADGATRVLLLEAGGDDRPLKEPGQLLSNAMIHMPGGFAATLSDRRVNWMYQTEPDIAGRVHKWPKGKVLGGSSSINGLLYVRGQRADFDGWRQLGCTGWAWDDLAPYFRRAQHQERGACDVHGVGGPLHISDVAEFHPVTEAMLDACAQAGVPRVADVNGASQEGATWFQLTVREGRRCSAAVAYLHPAMARANLRIETHALATRIRFEGRRAAGVDYLRGNEPRLATATREIILAAGSVASPQLLELSGVGRADMLRALGLEPVHDLPGVGENLQDHYMTGLQWRLRPGTPSVNARVRGLALAQEMLRYWTRRRGLMAQSAAHAVAFARSREGLAGPDLQFHLMPATMDLTAFGQRQALVLERRPGMTIAPCQLRPESRGSVHLRAPNPRLAPAIVPNYLGHPLDLEVLTAGVRLARSIAAQPALAELVESETSPGAAIDTDSEIEDYVRTVGSTLYHPVGTCRMGSDAAAVVDPELRVHGLDGLRVIDASIMPRITSGNTNAPVIAIAERGADLVLGRARSAGALAA